MNVISPIQTGTKPVQHVTDENFPSFIDTPYIVARRAGDQVQFLTMEKTTIGKSKKTRYVSNRYQCDAKTFDHNFQDFSDLCNPEKKSGWSLHAVSNVHINKDICDDFEDLMVVLKVSQDKDQRDFAHIAASLLGKEARLRIESRIMDNFRKNKNMVTEITADFGSISRRYASQKLGEALKDPNATEKYRDLPVQNDPVAVFATVAEGTPIKVRLFKSDPFTSKHSPLSFKA